MEGLYGVFFMVVVRKFISIHFPPLHTTSLRVAVNDANFLNV